MVPESSSDVAHPSLTAERNRCRRGVAMLIVRFDESDSNDQYSTADETNYSLKFSSH